MTPQDEKVEDRNEKLRALWLLVRRAGGELHIPAEEAAAAPATLGVTSVRQLDGRISLWADEAGSGAGAAGRSEGYTDMSAFLNWCLGICTQAGCDGTAEVEPDQDLGWCEHCGQNSIKRVR